MTPGVRIVVAGTSGGVGTTTVAALLFDGLRARPQGAPALFDHSGGDLGSRLPHGDEVASVDHAVAVQDAGRHATRIALSVLERPHDLLVVVAPATPLGFEEAQGVLDAVTASTGTQGRRRTMLVLTEPFGPVRAAAELERFRAGWERRAVHPLPRDPALAVGGRIARPRLRAATGRSVHALTAHVSDLVQRHRASALAASPLAPPPHSL